MKVHFLGTNGWYDTPTGETVCTLIDAREAYIVLDAGNGIRKLGGLIKDDQKPILLFLSHFHLDHTFGLHILPGFSFRQGMDVYGQPGTREALGRLISPPFTAPLDLLCSQMRFTINDLAEGTNLMAGPRGPIQVVTRYLVHKDPCFGYSFLLEGKRIVYCTDTGVCEGMRYLAKGADLLISECSWKVPNQTPSWPHIAPEDAAAIAKEAGAKTLALTHFDAAQYLSRKERLGAAALARKIFKGTVVAAEDDLVLEL